jgi:hypothetical protein
MSDDKNKEPLEERLKSIIRKKSDENSALKHLLERLIENDENENKSEQNKQK